DNVFSFAVTVPPGQAVGPLSFPATITDAQSHTVNTNIALNVVTPLAPVGTSQPPSAFPGCSPLLTVALSVPACANSSSQAVTVDLSAIGGSSTQTFFDDGTHGDVTPGDKVFSFLATVAVATPPGTASLPVSAADAQGHTGTAAISLPINVPPQP